MDSVASEGRITEVQTLRMGPNMVISPKYHMPTLSTGRLKYFGEWKHERRNCFPDFYACIISTVKIEIKKAKN